MLGQSPISIEVKSVSDVDVCGNKLFQIYVQTNEIYVSDSIVGFDLYLGYNPDKIQLDQLLVANTLSSQFQNNGSESILTINKTISGEVWISGAYFVEKKFLKGKLPLIAISGRYLKECTDTTEIAILDFIPAYYDFTKIPPQLQITNLALKATVANLSGRSFQAEIKEEIIKIANTDSIATINVYLRNDDIARNKNVELSIFLNRNENINIEDIESTNSTFIIETIERKLDTVILKAKILGVIAKDTPTIVFKIQRKSFNSDTVSAFIIIRKLTDCNCISQINNDSFNIQIQKKLISSVEFEDKDSMSPKVYLQKIGDRYEIQSYDNTLSQINIYNSLGQLLEKINCSVSKVELSGDKLMNGLNIIEVIVNCNNKVNKKLIKYIK